MSELQAKMQPSSALQPFAFDPRRVNVAVHIRRGDINLPVESALKSSPEARAANMSKRDQNALRRFVPERWYHDVRARTHAVLCCAVMALHVRAGLGASPLLQVRS